MVLLETDHNAYTRESIQANKKRVAEEMVEVADADDQELAAEMAASFLQEDLPEATYGAPKAGQGKWFDFV